MRRNETQLNSFMFNILILNACSLAITLQTCGMMRAYTLESYIYKFLMIFKYSAFMFYFTQDQIIELIVVSMAVLTVLLNLCKGGYRLRFEDLEKKY